MNDFEMLEAAILSGQVSAAQLGRHMEDHKFARWFAERQSGSRMTNVIKIGCPPGSAKAVRLMPADEARANDIDAAMQQRAVLRSSAKWQATRIFERIVDSLGEQEARRLMLEVAKELFKE